MRYLCGFAAAAAAMVWIVRRAYRPLGMEILEGETTWRWTEEADQSLRHEVRPVRPADNDEADPPLPWLC